MASLVTVLIVLLIVGIVLASLTLFAFVRLSKERHVRKPENYSELDPWVKKSVRSGKSREDIHKDLVSEGWPKHEVQSAIKRTHQPRRKKFLRFFPRRRKSEEQIVQKMVKDLIAKKAKIDNHGIQDLEEIREHMENLRHEIKEDLPKVLDDDVKRVLRITDELLGNLPKSEIDKFAKSEDYMVYKKVMKKTYKPTIKSPQEISKLDKVLTLLERKVIDINEARSMLGLPIRYLEPRAVHRIDKKQVLDELKEHRNED